MHKITEHEFESWDGTDLFYRSWIPAQKKKIQQAVILFHRGHEHSARWQDVIDQLDMPEMAFFAWDARGHGKSPGERGYAPDFGTLIKDVDTFIRHLSETHDIKQQDMVVMAHSVGSVLVSSWVHDYAPPIRALVLGSPALRVRLYVPFAVPGLRLLQKIRGKFFISSYVKGRLLTHDAAKQKSYDNDPLITPNIAVNILLGLYDAGTRLMRDSGAITPPVLVLSSGADFVVKQSAQRAFYDGLPHIRKEMQSFPGFLHDTFNEKDNHKPINKARLFITEVFERPFEQPDLTDADQQGYSWEEYQRLSKPLPLLSPKGLQFALARLGMKTLGRLSGGIRLGWDKGFDSGAMLDYVYENQARGTSFLGRMMDRQYLDSPGWAGIRERKRHLEILIREAITHLSEENSKARIVDVATGHGRYVLDAIEDHMEQVESALLRDYDTNNVASGSRLAQQRGLDKVSCRQGNAFEPDSLAEIDNDPNLAIVSGLFELFPENAPVATCLKELSKKVKSGGYLVYTNQPWHPQLEFIAYVLTSHRDGSPWIMRRRTQLEMDQLVSAAGFRKIRQLGDENGIFTVSLAQRI